MVGEDPAEGSRTDRGRASQEALVTFAAYVCFGAEAAAKWRCAPCVHR